MSDDRSKPDSISIEQGTISNNRLRYSDTTTPDKFCRLSIPLFLLR